jgi:hypothetical protein
VNDVRSFHPSNRLYNGEVTSAREALGAYAAQFRYEAATPYPGWEKDLIEGDAGAFSAAMEKGAADGDRLLAQYNERVGAAERALFEEWAGSADEDVRRIGEASLSGDWSSLAL